MLLNGTLSLVGMLFYFIFSLLSFHSFRNSNYGIIPECMYGLLSRLSLLILVGVCIISLNKLILPIADSPTDETAQALSITGFCAHQTYLPDQMVFTYCLLLSLGFGFLEKFY